MKTKKRALIVGIDHYQQRGMDLRSAVKDARAMARLLGNHQDGMLNFDCLLWADETDARQPITRAALRNAVQQLFNEFRGDVLFYFSGHGCVTPTGGWLVTCDGGPNDWGVSMDEVFQLASNSQAATILLILDCCHAGDIASLSLRSEDGRRMAVLREDMTVIAASMPRETASETREHGLFTGAVLDALEGGATDTMGWVTAPAIYAYVERRFGGWPQQPVYKSSSTQVPVVRECAPLIERLKLNRLIEVFATPDFRLRLDPAFEPEDATGKVRKPIHAEKIELAKLLKEYRDAGLLKPSIPGEQLYWTARKSHTVELTPRGKEYWWLVKMGKI
jgi:hypothetical protein